MTDKQKVKSKYRQAVAFKWTGYWRIYKSFRVTETSEIISDSFVDQEEAWADAARKLDGDQ